MVRQRGKLFCAALSLLMMTALPVSAEQIKESYHPRVNGSPVTLMKDNALTQALGGRLVNLDVWAGEFVKFDDNIFNTEKDKKNDTIFSTAAGVLAQGEQKDVWKFRLEGQVQRNDYVDHKDFNGFEGFLHGQGSVDFSPALSARAKLNYDRSYDNVRNIEDIYGMNRMSTGAGMSVRPTPFLGFDLDYTYFMQRREDTAVEYQDYDEHTVSFRPSFALSPNTAVYAQFDMGQATPVKDHYNTSQAYAGLLGLAWSYKDTAKIIAEVGYKHMHFDDNGNIRDTTTDMGSATGHLRAEYGFTADWTAGVDFAYAPVYGGVTSNASQSNYINRFTSSAFLSYSPGEGRFTFDIRPYYTNSNPSEDDLYSEYGVNLGVTYVVTDWFNVNAGYTFGVTDYEDRDAYSRNMITLGAALTF